MSRINDVSSDTYIQKERLFMMFTRKGLSWLVVAGIASTTLLSGCSSSKEAATPGSSSTPAASAAPAVSASPSSGKAVKNVWEDATLQGTPSKPVALDFFIVDMLVSLGVNPAGIAGTDKTRVPDYIKSQVPAFTDIGERKAPNLEVIRSVKPDLIIANPERAKSIKGDLQKIAPTIALSDKTYKAILDNVDLLGDVFGKKEQAQKVRADLEKKVKDAREKVKNEPTALVVGAFDDDMSVWVKQSFVASLLSDIGLTYSFAGDKEKSEGTADIATMTVERLAELNPDYLFLYGAGVDKLKANPLYKNLKAVKEGRVLVVEQDLWSRARGPIAAGHMIDQAVTFISGAAK